MKRRTATTSAARLLALMLVLDAPGVTSGFSASPSASTTRSNTRQTISRPSSASFIRSRPGVGPLQLQPTSSNDDIGKRPAGSQVSAYSSLDYGMSELPSPQQSATSAAAAAVASTLTGGNPGQSIGTVLKDFVMPILYTSMLVTSNTVGAGMLVLPELCAGPGMGISTGLFLGLYTINLLSGLLIAEVSIKQRESSGDDAPSSFKALSEANVDIPYATDAIAFISIVKNALVLAFGTMKASEICAGIFGIDPTAASIAWVALFAAVVGTQSAPNLSKIASMFVMGLFGSLAALLLPGLAAVQDPLSVMSMPPQSADVIGSAMHAAPIILMSFIFQNIIPTVSRILDYDRTKIIATLCLGSFVPLAMYMAWCVAVLGGGVDLSVGMDGTLFTIFSLVTIAGSHLGSCTSMAEEFDTYFKADKNESVEPASEPQSSDTDRSNDVFSLPAVVTPALMAVGFGQLFQDDLTDLLKFAGAYGSPLLYFGLPVAMAWTQREKFPSLPNLVPGNKAPLFASTAVGVGFVASEIFQSFAATGAV